jgi:hypothetical protein
MDGVLIGALNKLQRADQHVKEFEASLDVFLRQNPQRLAIDPKTATLKELKFVRDPVPPALICVVGDALHNMRSALDHIAYAVAKRNNVLEKFLERVNFTTRERQTDFNDALKERKVACIGGAWELFLRRIEPYRGGKGENLHVISALDNIDKHRDLIVLETLGDTAIWDEANSQWVPVQTGLSFKDGIELQLDPTKPHYHTATRTRVVIGEAVPGLDPDAFVQEALALLVTSVRDTIVSAATDTALWP